jgi:Fe2+ transport system protein FeoA
LRFSLNKDCFDRIAALPPAKVPVVKPEPAVPLELLRPGEWAEVEEVSGEPGWVGRLAELGVRVGCRLCLLQGGCPCLLQVGGCRLSLRGECAMQILVRPVACAG